MYLRLKFLIMMTAAAVFLIAAEAYCVSLSELAAPGNGRSSRESSFDKKGGNDDYIEIKSGEKIMFADIKGPASLNHIWFTFMEEPVSLLQGLVLIIYWDDEENPSVNCPIGEFFAMNFGVFSEYSSAPFIITGTEYFYALNSYWKMPFNKRARFFLRNDNQTKCQRFYYHIDYEKYGKPQPDTLYFHAQYSHAFPATGGDYILLETKGRGRYAGCSFGVQAASDAWWGEGDEKIIIDGDEAQALMGTGFEDYFSNAWCYQKTFSTPYYGCVQWCGGFMTGGRTSVYRFHIEDPINFEKSVKITFEHGSQNDRSDHFTSVAYWYQSEPHLTMPDIPPLAKRLPPELNKPVELDSSELNIFKCRGGEVIKEKQLDEKGQPTGKRTFLFTNAPLLSGVEITFPAAKNGGFSIALAPEFSERGGIFDIYINDVLIHKDFDFYKSKKSSGALTDIGSAVLRYGNNTIKFQNTGKNEKSSGYDFAFKKLKITPKR